MAVLAAVGFSSPVLPRNDQSQHSPIIQYENYDTENGHHFSWVVYAQYTCTYWIILLIFFLRYGTIDGQQRDEELIILNKGEENEEIVITGHYSYKGSDGLLYHVSYTADKNGYHATVDTPRVEAGGLFPGSLPVAEVLVPGAPVAARRPVVHRPSRY